MTHWLSILFFVLHLFQPLPFVPQASGEVTFTDDKPEWQFGQQVTFSVHLTSSETIEKVFVSIASQGSNAVFYPMDLNEQGDATFRLDLTQHPLRAFSQVNYYYRASLASGKDFDSRPNAFEYADKRFTWKSLENPSFKVFWYERDADFGQTALNTAQSGLDAALKLVPARLKGQVRIYIYASIADLQSTRLGAQPWVAGHASPDLHLVMVSIPSGPSQRLELERQLPHEITHILQFDAFGQHAKELPIWLLEGTASVAELYPDADYASVLQAAVQQDQLLPLESLCTVFPRDAANAYLAYAQSQSFVRFLYRKYGSSGLQTLYEKYRDGLGCTQGLEAAYGIAVPELIYHWRLEELGVNPAALIVQNLLPYFLLLFIILGAASLGIVLSTRRRKAALHAG